MDHNQRTSKNRLQDSVKQAKKFEESQKSRQGMSGTQSSVASVTVAGAPDIQFVNADFIRQQLGTVDAAHKSGASLTTVPVSTQVKLPRGSNLYHASLPGQVVVLKTEKEGTPSPVGDPPPPPPSHTTKSSSLSRDISPSRITAQVVSAMSESSQPLLLSALTGKMPTPLMMGAPARPEALQDVKHKQAEATTLRTSPHSVAEQRSSPAHADGQAQMETKAVKTVRTVQAGLPFESLMQVASLALEMHSGSSPGRHQVGLGAQLHGPGNHQSAESRNQTPSPKPVSAGRSPQRHGGQQGQRRSPVGSRSSPAPNHSQEAPAAKATASASGGTLLPVPMGLVQQHLLAETITTTSMAPGAHSKTGTVLSLHSLQHPAVPAASSAPFVTQPTIHLTTVPISVSALPSSQKGKGSENCHAVSVGTGTESKHYASHGAQTKKVSNAGEAVKLKLDETVVVHAFQPHRKEGVSQSQDSGVRNQGVSGVSASSNLVVVSGGKELNRFSPVMPAGTVSHPVSGGLPHAGAVPSSQAFTVPASSVVPSFTSLSSSSARDLTRCQASTVIERKRHSPSPTPAHGNKPISVPSSLAHTHTHTHIHHPSPHPRPHVLVTTASFTPSSVNHVSTAPVAQPVVSLSRLPTPSARTEPSVVKVKQEPKVVSAVSSSHAVTSANYQPHHHHYHQDSQPAQTITSQTVEAGPVVKDFVPVVGSPEPPPYHQQPPLPPHVNPFTFPTSGIKIHFPAGDGPSYSLSSQGKAYERTEAKAFERADAHQSASHRSVSDVTSQRQHQHQQHQHQHQQQQQQQHQHQCLEAMELQEEMPQLTPERFLPPKSEVPFKHGAFSHVGRVQVDGKEQLMNPFNMRLQNLNNFPSMATAYRSAYRSHSIALQRAKAGLICSAAKSLDLLRQNIQKDIGRELNQIVQKYVDTFFRPAADNIRLNNGPNSVGEEHINAVCRQIFEEAKRMYTTEARRSITPIGDFPDNVSETSSLNGRRVSPIPASKRLKAYDSDSERGSDGGAPKKIPRRKGRPPLNSSGRSTPIKPQKSEYVRREGPKWNPERVRSETQFVMGARANKALGLGNTRGRLYIRHPDVFKYSGDQEDKVWLHEQKLMPATGGKAYMLLVEDIVDLSKSDEYKDSPTLMMHECRGFEVPEWMLIKIRAAMQALRSDGSKRSRSRSPLSDQLEPPKSLPFSNFSDTASNNDVDSNGNKNSLQPSPTDTEEMEFLSAADNDDTQPSDVSSFNVTGGFDDTPSRSPCPMEPADDDQPVATPFT